MKAPLIIFAAFFLAGCNHTTARSHRTVVVNIINCDTCRKPEVTCENCRRTEGTTKRTACSEGKIQGEFGQVFRVECPSGRGVPDIVR